MFLMYLQSYLSIGTMCCKMNGRLRLSTHVQADHIFKRESEMYDIYLLPPGEDPETCPSWLRMRNRDGRYDLRFEEWVVDDPFVISPRISFEVLHSHGSQILKRNCCATVIGDCTPARGKRAKPKT